MQKQTFASMQDLGHEPRQALNMRLRRELMHALQEAIRGWGATQAEAARRLGITQPRLNDLLRGRVEKFSLDALANLAGHAGLAVRLNLRGAAWKGDGWRIPPGG